MIKDLKYILKRILISTGIAICLMYLKGGLIGNVYAMPTKLTYYTGDYSVLYQTSQYEGNTASINNVSRIRLNFNDSLISGGTYNVTLRLQISRLNARPVFDGGSGLFPSNVITVNSVNVINNSDNQSSLTYSRDFTIVYSFTANSNSNDWFFEGSFNVPYRITGFNVASYSINYTGSNLNTNDIINNDNQNTNNIINNAHADTNNITNHIDGVNNNLTDDNVDESSNKAQEFFNDFDSGDTGNLTDIISLPLDFLNQLNNKCSSIVLPIPYFGNLTLPCIQSYLSSFLPNNLLTLIKLIVNGFLTYKIIANLVDFINSLKDPNNNDLEVIDL